MVMAKKSPYEPEELAQMMRVADRCKGEITIQYPDLRPLRESGAITDEELMRWQPIAKWIGPVAEMCRKSRPLKGLLANIKTAPSFNTAVNDDRPFMYGSGFRRINSPQEKMIRELYRNLLIIMVALAVVFIALPLFVSKADSGEKVRLDPRLLAILLLTGLGFMFVEMSGIFKYQLYMHHPTIAMIVILAGMILGAGLGSLHSDRIGEERKEGAIPFYAAISAVGALALLFFLPLYGHGLMLWLPLEALLPIMFVLFAGLGFFMGHVVPLSIGAFARNQERLLAWCWAITVTGSVFGTVIASILSRDYGMYVIIALGVACYLGVVLTVLIGKLATRKKPAAAAA
jgi:hypothetical protein